MLSWIRKMVEDILRKEGGEQSVERWRLRKSNRNHKQGKEKRIKRRKSASSGGKGKKQVRGMMGYTHQQKEKINSA